MHLQFGKLYLGHHVFRGLQSDPIPPHLLKAADMAHEAARSIFEMILDNEKLRESLVGRPHYVFIMISFAGHFLLEVCKKYSEQLSIDSENTFRLMDKVLTVFSHIPLIPQHPLSRMTNGLRRKAIECVSSVRKGSAVVETLGQSTRNDFNQVNTMYSAGSTLLSSNDNISTTAPFYFSTGQVSADWEPFLYTDYDAFNFPDMSMNFFT
jgi:hypothetical protein